MGSPREGRRPSEPIMSRRRSQSVSPGQNRRPSAPTPLGSQEFQVPSDEFTRGSTNNVGVGLEPLLWNWSPSVASLFGVSGEGGAWHSSTLDAWSPVPNCGRMVSHCFVSKYALWFYFPQELLALVGSLPSLLTTHIINHGDPGEVCPPIYRGQYSVACTWRVGRGSWRL